jgi:hypothetical protein
LKNIFTKKTVVIYTLFVFAQVILKAQAIPTKSQLVSTDVSIDLDLGLHISKVENPVLESSGSFITQVHTQSFIGYYWDINIFKRIIHFSPDFSVGFFIKPGLGSNLHKHSLMMDYSSYLALQLPVGVAIELGQTNNGSSGVVIGVAPMLNFYNYRYGKNYFTLYKTCPYFFVQAHAGPIGLRFAMAPGRAQVGSNGNITRSLIDCSLSMVATMPYKKYKK